MALKKRRIKASDLYRIRQISHPEISPDGKHVVYAVQRVDRQTEKKYTNLWWVATSGGKAHPFTTGDHVDSQPRWSPDGQWVAFISNRADEKQPQLYLIPANGGEARKLTDLKGEFASFAWSPDGKQIICQFRKKDKEALKREKDERKKKLGLVYRRITRLHYSLDGYGFLPQERWHLWIIDVKSGKAKQLTSGKVYDEKSPCWSPDGKQIAFVSNRSVDPDLHPDEDDLYLIPATGGEMRKLNAPLGPKSLPRFSPDGKWVAYIGHEGRGDWWKNERLWIVPTESDEAARCLTKDFDVTLNPFTINDVGSAEMMPPTWSNDGQKLYFQVSQHGSTTLNAINVSGGEMEEVIGPGGVVGTYTFDQSQQKLAYFYGQMKDPAQVWLREMPTGKSRQLTNLNSKLLSRLDLGEIEEVWFKGPDDNDLQGWILKPPDFDPKKQYPSVLEIHGGPMAQYGNFFMHEFYYLAAHGYVVYFSNPRGGLGYGEEHAKAIWGGWGGADYDDLMAWTDYMLQQPYIDPQRLGVTGGSYGGYMTAWIIGHTKRYQAAVAQRSVTNCVSMWGSSDANWVFQMPWGNKPPYEDIEALWESSPMKHVGNARTPTLVIHSERDMRCPLEQGQQLYVALKTLHVDTELILFPDEPHGLSRVGRTDRRIARLKHIRRWFDRYLAA